MSFPPTPSTTTPAGVVVRPAGIGALRVMLLRAGAIAIAALYSGQLSPAESTPLLVTVVGVIVTTVTSLTGASYAKRADDAIRDGVVVEKVKQGTREVIAEENLLTRDGPTVTTQVEALAELVRTVHELRTGEPWDGTERRRRTVYPPPDPPTDAAPAPAPTPEETP